ncbi:MAG: hypothetical protein LBH91_01970 [Prevotellaceae bacterium]|jgi:hypothetical protein|nr:hypothetical protein [Prevotellaceae bacterium]
MKSINKFLSLLTVLAVTLWACEDNTERTLSPEANPNSPVVYFPAQDNEFVLPLDATFVEVEIARENTSTALIVPLHANFSGNYGQLFTIPQSVSFDAGETTKIITVQIGAIKLMEHYCLSIEVADFNLTNPYKEGRLPVVGVGIVKEDYEFWKICQWTDGLVATLFNIPYPDPTIPVKVEYSRATKRLRLLSPYGYDYPYNDPEDVVRDPSYIVIDVSDPNDVQIWSDKQVSNGWGMGLDWGYGEMFFGLIGNPGVMEDDTTIVFEGEKTLAFGMTNYNTGKLFDCKTCILKLPEPLPVD